MPIFHQNAKYLASGVGVGQCTRRQNFALPNAKYTNMLVSFALGDANSLRWPCTFLFFCVDFFALGSQCEPHFQWNIGGGGFPMEHFRVGHVHFMLFIPFFSALGTQRECFSQWNMGFNSPQADYTLSGCCRLKMTPWTSKVADQSIN